MLASWEGCRLLGLGLLDSLSGSCLQIGTWDILVYDVKTSVTGTERELDQLCPGARGRAF